MYDTTSSLFIRSFFITVVSVFLAVATFNFVIDPFNLFGSPRINKVNAQKPEFSKRTRMTKANAVRRKLPRGLILGSSRAEYGLDPQHPAWTEHSRPVYNLAFSSASIYEALRYLEHAHALQKVNEVVLNLDMFMFNAAQQRQIGFRENRLARTPKFTLQIGWLHDMVNALFTIDGVRASVNTLLNQGNPSLVPNLPDGRAATTRHKDRIRQKGGHRKAFLSNERYSLDAIDGWALFTLEDPSGARPGMRSFQELVAFCHREGIELHISISPVHARKLEVLWQLGMWPIFENWKRELLHIVETANSLHPIHDAFLLWDFSGYSTITTETVPPLGDRQTEMKWYWEGSHFKKVVGDQMLDRMLEGKSTYDEVLGVFGVKLTSGNIEDYLKLVRAGHEIFVNNTPDAVTDIEKLVEQTKDRRMQLVHHYASHPET